MQSTDLGDRDDAALARRLGPSGERRIAVERQVGSGLVIVREVSAQDPKQVVLVEHGQVTQALAPNRADEAFNVR